MGFVLFLYFTGNLGTESIRVGTRVRMESQLSPSLCWSLLHLLCLPIPGRGPELSNGPPSEMPAWSWHTAAGCGFWRLCEEVRPHILANHRSIFETCLPTDVVSRLPERFLMQPTASLAVSSAFF